MAKALESLTFTVPDGSGATPQIIARNVDPSAGGGVVAPIGSLLLRTDVAQLWQKVGAGNTAWDKFDQATINLINVSYVATGAEGTDFMVTIGSTLPNDVYGVYFSPKGVTLIPVVDLPDTLAGDRTTTQFRVITSGALTAGDILAFLVVQN